MATPVLQPILVSPHASSMPSSSPASSSSSHTSMSTRKIRFAPLPDPHRTPTPDDDEDDDNDDDADNHNHLLDALSHEIASLHSFSSSSKRHSYSTDSDSTPGTATPASLTNTTPSEYDCSAPASPASLPVVLPPPPPAQPTMSWPKSRGLSLFRSFKRSSTSSSSSSSNSLTPTPSIDRTATSSRKGISAEEILTLGTINLFRTSSHDSADTDRHHTGGWSLTRWASGPGPASKPAGVPLERTQSTQSYKSKTPSLLSGLRSAPAPKRKPRKPVPPNRKGTRMLNGRVYGSKRDPNANPFANARDEEPEFVEWGYGGMGSVKGAKSAGVSGAGWEKLHGSSAAEDDLGAAAGMAWVKKRKEAREKKEREEREAKEKAAAAGAVVDETPADTPTLPPSEGVATPTASAAEIVPVSNPLAGLSTASVNTHHSSASTAGPSATAPGSAGADEHVFTTLAIPMQRHHHHRTHTRTASKDTTTSPTGPDGPSPSSSGTESESESESDPEREREEEEEEEEEEGYDDDEEEAQRRAAMVIGAGMEKVSRRGVESDEHAATASSPTSA